MFGSQVVLNIFFAALLASSSGLAAAGAPSHAPELVAAKDNEGLGQEAPETETVHILVGRSILVNMQARLRKVYLSNPAVLDSTTTTPTQVVISAKSPGSSNVVFWDEEGHSRMLEVFADLDIGGFRDAIQQEYPSQAIEARAEQGRIILNGTVSDKDTYDNIGKMALVYSKDVVNALVINRPAHGKQIMLKVRFAEVDRTRLQAFGVNLLSTGAGNTPGSISTQSFGTPSLNGQLSGVIGGGLKGTTTTYSVSDLLNIFLFRPDLNLGLTIKDLQQKNVLQILAEPNLMAISGETAHFLAGGEFPYPVVQGTGGTGSTAVTIQFRPYGVKLEFNGTVQPDGSIRLKVSPEVSSLDYANAVTISGFTVPALSTRRAETDVELKDGQSFGIAGLLDSTTTIQLSKVPGIASVPILGQLFHSRSKNLSQSELLVVITPTVIDPLTAETPAPVMPKPAAPTLDRDGFDHEIHGEGVTAPVGK